MPAFLLSSWLTVCNGSLLAYFMTDCFLLFIMRTCFNNICRLAPMMMAFLLHECLPYCTVAIAYLMTDLASTPAAFLLSSFCHLAHIMMTFLVHSRLTSCSHNGILAPIKASFWLFIIITILLPRQPYFFLYLISYLLSYLILSPMVSSFLLLHVCYLATIIEAFLFRSSCLLAHIMTA